jgi:hypothetical protein
MVADGLARLWSALPLFLVLLLPVNGALSQTPGTQSSIIQATPDTYPDPPSEAPQQQKTTASQGATPSSIPAAPRSEALALRRVGRHFRDYYFIVLDETRVDTGSRAAMDAVADELTRGTAVERVGPAFVRPPQGLRVAGTEAAVLELARDPRVKWVEEVSTFLRALEARPGEYAVVLQRSIFGESRIHRSDVRRVAEDLVRRYGGRVTENIWESALIGFGLENASEESARAMSEDPRVEYVAEHPALGASAPTPKVDDDHTP